MITGHARRTCLTARKSNLSQRALHACKTPAQHVGINLRSTNICMAKQFLNGTDVRALLQQMCSKRMTECVTTSRLVYSHLFDSTPDCLLYCADMQMMAHHPSSIVFA